MRINLLLLLIPALPCVGCIQAPGEQVSAPVPVVRVVARATSDDAEQLDWADLAFTVKDRSKFDLGQLPDAVRQLDRRRVRLRGYFHLGVAGREVQEFLLFGEINTAPTVVKPGTLPSEYPIHQIAAVEMSPGKSATFTLEPVAVTGRLALKVVEWDGEAWLVFHIVADSVEPVRKRSGYAPAVSGGC